MVARCAEEEACEEALEDMIDAQNAMANSIKEEVNDNLYKTLITSFL